MSCFIHLNVCSDYSFGNSSLKIKSIINSAKHFNMPAVLLADDMNMFGAFEFASEALKNGVQPITGIRVKVLYYKKIIELILAAKNETGYTNLIQIASMPYTNNMVDAILQINDLKKYSSDIMVILSDCSSIINNPTELNNFCLLLNSQFKNHLYLGITRYGSAGKNENKLLDIGYNNNIPIIASNKALFLNDIETVKRLNCIISGERYNDENFTYSKDNNFKPPNLMVDLFADLPEAIENTVQFAKRIEFILTPKKPVMPEFPCRHGKTVLEEFKHQSQYGLEKRFKNLSIRDKKVYLDQMDYEIKVILKMGFESYFLIVSDFIKWAKSKKIPVGPGRGSGAGSIVAWALMITDIDPIRFGLIFERFLNPDRISLPDFDIDFCQERRDEVIEYVKEKYGYHNVAHIITFGKMQARAVLKDVGRTFGIPHGLMNKISQFVPNNPAMPVNLADAIKNDPMLNACLNIKTIKEHAILSEMCRGFEESISKCMKESLALEGVSRNISTHAAGIVISDRPLFQTIPIYKEDVNDNNSTIITQYNMKYVEASGLIKFDFLGLKTLTLISNCINLIKEYRNTDIDIGLIAFDDKKTFDLLCNVDVVGVFQLESAGMRDVLSKFSPSSVHDIMAQIALYRPGPMDEIPRYINCKNGTEKISYFDDRLKSILDETYGVIVYQEQVLEIAKVLAGYTLGQADILRRAMGKKIAKEMQEQKIKFINGCIANSVTKENAEKLFDQIDSFAQYAFNRAHAAAYSVITYQTAYLKAHYRVEFMIALMNIDIENSDKLRGYCTEAIKADIKILPPCINRSDEYFKIEINQNGDKCIRYGLCAINSLSFKSSSMLIKRRRGGFKSLQDFITCLHNKDINKRQFEMLIKSGAMEAIFSDAYLLFYNIQNLFLGKGQSASLPFDDDILLKNPEDLETKWTEDIISQNEREALGFYLKKHPLSPYEKIISNLKIDSIPIIYDFMMQRIGKEITFNMCGVITYFKKRQSKTGRPYMFIGISDQYGECEGIAFSDVLNDSIDIIKEGMPVYIRANGKIDADVMRITIRSITAFKEFITQSISNIKISITKESAIKKLKTILDKTNQTGNVDINVKIDENEYKIGSKYDINYMNITKICDIDGIDLINL